MRFWLSCVILLFCLSHSAFSQCVGSSGFTISSPTCAGQAITFTDTTSATPDSVVWVFPDSSFNTRTLTRTFSSAQSITVWMYRYFSSPACVDSVSNALNVVQPIATISPASTVNICAGDSATFTANTGSGLSYQWRLGGANISGATSSSLKAAATGKYSVAVTQSGCAAISDSVQLNVYNYPTAGFNFSPDSACSGSIVAFTNTSTGSSLSYLWKFSSVSTDTTSLQNPDHVFDTVGTRAIVSYTVKLVVSTPGGCKDSITKTVKVRRKPDASIDDFNNLPKFRQCNVSASAFALQITNISSTVATNKSYFVQWGDGDTATFGPSFDTVTHVYATNGLYPLKVTVTDSFGCTNTSTTNVFNGGNPAVSLGNSGSTSGCTPYSVTFTIDTSASGVGLNAPGTLYTLTFNDGSLPIVFTHPPPPQYIKVFTTPSCSTLTSGFPNSFQAELTATNPCGANSGTVRPIYISTKPIARIGIFPQRDTVCQDDITTVYDSTIRGSVSSAAGCTPSPRRLWNISPSTGWTLVTGSLGNASNFNNNPANWGSASLGIKFTDTGYFDVRLVVGNIAQAGLSVCGDDTIVKHIRVFAPPKAIFSLSANPSNACVNTVVTTTNNSTGQNISQQWTITPATGFTVTTGSMSSVHPTFTFTTPGDYIVKLRVTNLCDRDSTTDTIRIKGKPIVSLGLPFTFCGNGLVNWDTIGSNPNRPLYNKVFGDTLSYNWHISGPNTYIYTSGDSTTANPKVNFTGEGTYNIRLTFTNECGSDTGNQVVTVNPYPDAKFGVNDTDQCLDGNNFVFTDSSTITSGSIVSHNWDFGNSTTSTATNPSKNYAGAGTYPVRLIVASGQGCADTVIKNVYVYVEPTADFSINDTDQCLFANSFAFTNNSSISSGTLSYKWYFSNRPQDTSVSANPSWTYDSAGNYAVKLVITSDHGCVDSIIKTLRVYADPTAAYSINDTDQCINGNNFVFTNSSTVFPGSLTYLWSFSGTAGDTSTSANPAKTYTTAGTYNVQLIASSGSGCNDTLTKTVYVYPKPDIAFTVNDSTQCFNGNSFVFTNNSSIGSGTVNYLWRFSATANDTSTLVNPTKAYTSTGAFPVKLVGTSDQGCKDSALQNMTVYDEPNAAFSVNDTDQCLNGNNFQFTDNSTAVGSFSRDWSFGDGSTSTSNGPSKTYSTDSTYTVKLLITTTPGGCKDSAQKTVYVYPKPNPAFTINDTLQCYPGHVFVLTNGSTIHTGTVTYKWSFGSSAADTSNAASPNKTYTSAGSYTIKLVATSDKGCKDSTQTGVTVRPDIINNNIAASQNLCSGSDADTLKQNGSAVSGGDGTFSYQWQESTDSASWSDISGATSSFYAPGVVSTTKWYRRKVASGPCTDTSAPVKIAVAPGISNNLISAPQSICSGFTPARLNGTVPTGGGSSLTYQWQESNDGVSWSNIGGATDTNYQPPSLTQTKYYRRQASSSVCTVNGSSLRIAVNPNPLAGFTVPSACFGFSNNFTNTSTVSTGSISGNSWDFGDATSASSASPSKSYAAFGNYTVKLIVTTDSNCKDSITRTARVNPKPVSVFTANDTCFNFAHSFDGTASNVAAGSISAYNWNFGDATAATGSTTTKTYSADGVYTAKLVVTTDSSCKDSITHNITVHPKPTPAYTVNDSDQCVNGNNFAFTNTSSISGGTQTYLWSFSTTANDTSTQTSPSKVYGANDTYLVKLVATSNFGCKDSTSKNMVVFSKPTPAHTINDTDQCVNGNNFVFTNGSSITPSETLNYTWRFGDGNTSASSSPNYSYAAAGTYTVRLVVTSSNNCLDSVERPVYVYPKPTPAFSINDTLQCFSGNSFTFTNGSSISAGTLTYLWNFGTGSNDTATTVNAAKQYAGSGTFTIKLKATSDQGCKDSISKPVTVNPDIAQNAVAPGQNICSGNAPDSLKQSGSALSGGNGTYTYQWQQSSDSLAWSSISGATSSFYKPGILTATVWYRRVIGSGPCADTSLPVKVAVAPGIDSNFISPPQSICSGFTPVRLNGTIPVGGGSTITYQWQQSNDSISWSDIGGATDTNYQPPALTQTKYYRRQASSSVCTVNGTPLRIAVNPNPVAGFTVPSACFGFSNSFTNTSTLSSGAITTNTWTFGDATNSAAQSPTKSYAAFGTYSVKLIVTTDSNCKDSIVHSARVNPKPAAAFTINDTCFGFAHSLNATASSVAAGSISNYSWTFGDATSGSGSTTTKTYSAAGTYTVKLITTTDSTCSDSITHNVIVHPRPVPAYTVNDSDQCVNGNNFAFTNGSTISSGTQSYLWKFSTTAGDTSTQINPNKVYGANGTYPVKLLTTSNFGCKDSISKNMVVFAKPTPAYAINDTDQCVNGNSFTYTNNSTISPANTLTYAWNFGDNTTSTSTSPTMSYATSDTYVVRLVVTSADNCKDSIQKAVYVWPKPTPAFSINDTLQCLGPNNFVFTNGSSISAGTLTYLWRFGSSAADTSNTTSPNKIYSSAGVYTIRLVATSDKGCKDSTQKNVEVKPNISNNAISSPQNICQGQAPDTLRQSGSSVGGGNGSFTYQWQQSTDSLSWTNISGATAVTYKPGTLSVTTWYRRLITSNPCGDTSAPVKILVTPGITNNTISSAQVICYAQTPATLNGAAPAGGTGAFIYQWQQGADTVSWGSASGTNNTTNYSPSSLTDTVYYRRRVISQACTTFSNILKIAVNPLPVVKWGNTTVCYPNGTAFTDSSTVNQGSNTAWAWTFGDSTGSILQHPNKTFTAAGSYTVKLIVTTNFGCKDSLSKVVTVHPKPRAGFVSPDLCFGFTSSFTDTSKLSTGSITAWAWTFGDTKSSAAQNPTNAYAAYGTYNVRLIVTTDKNCKDTVTKPLVVFPKPAAQFAVPDVCYPDSNRFNNTSNVATGSIVSQTWDFGDAGNSTVISPVHKYATDGSYNTKLIVTTDKGCKDSIAKAAVVHPLPIMAFTADTLNCINTSLTFTNNSTGAALYNWSYGDGDTANAFTGVNTYPNPGYFRIRLRGTTTFNCVDSIAKDIHIITPPNPKFTVLPDTGCAPLNVNFTNLSTGTYTTYNWDFGDGQTSTLYSPPQITYQQSHLGDTSYFITLTATNMCAVVKYTDSVTVFPIPIANFGTDVNSGCTPKTFKINNISAGNPDEFLWDFGDGTQATIKDPIQHQYVTDSVIRTFKIKLVIRNHCGMDSISRVVTVLPKNVKAFFNLDTVQGCSPLTVNITDFSKGSLNVRYDLGDGNTAIQRDVTHIFKTPGVYKIQQFASNTCTADTTFQTVTVFFDPNMSFTKNLPQQCLQQDIQFTNTSPSVSGMVWEFGDGDTSTQNNPKHKFAAAGKYHVKLTAVSVVNGCKNFAEDSVTVLPLPVPKISTDTSQGCPDLTVNFRDSSAGTIYVTWKFGDGNSTSIINPQYIYNKTGSYTAWMIIQDVHGCVDSTFKIITVQPVPIAAFTDTGTFCNPPTPVQFTNTSQGATQFSWTFSNGVNTSATNPTIVFNTAGTHWARINCKNQFGCVDTFSKSFEIFQKPVVNFSLDTNQGCPPVRVRFTGNSQNGTQYLWNFGDGDTSTAESPVHIYNTSGKYSVKLLVTNGGICSDSLTFATPVNVYPTPLAGFNYFFNNSQQGYGIAEFTDNSNNAFTYNWDFGDAGATSTDKNPSHKYDLPGNYLVTLIIATKEGCYDTTEQEIETPFFKGLFVPNAFTPESGVHEVRTFKPVGISLKNYKVSIYNSWGQLLWESMLLEDTRPKEGWDGTFNGMPMQQDAYVWKIEAEFLDGSTWPGQKGSDNRYHREGTVTLIR